MTSSTPLLVSMSVVLVVGVSAERFIAPERGGEEMIARNCEFIILKSFVKPRIG